MMFLLSDKDREALKKIKEAEALALMRQTAAQSMFQLAKLIMNPFYGAVLKKTVHASKLLRRQLTAPWRSE